jgi:hypothetical protein
MQTRTGIVKVQHKQEIRQPSLGPFSWAFALPLVFGINLFLRQKMIKIFYVSAGRA